MGNTLAIHWITTTHSTWVHGDVRGSWRNGQLIGPDPFLEESIRARMTDDAVVLSRIEIIQVAAVFGEVVGERRHRVYAATVQPTHAHIVFAPLNEDVSMVIARLKRRSAASVLTVRRNVNGEAPRHVWTAGQFPVFIFDEDHLFKAVHYVRNHNIRAGKPAEPWDWIQAPEWVQAIRTPGQ